MSGASGRRTRRAEWRAVARLARRTARREWRRTTLVAALVAVPVMVGIVVAGMVRASELTPTERVTSELGAADVLVRLHADGPRALRVGDPDVATMAGLVDEVDAERVVAHRSTVWYRTDHELFDGAQVVDLSIDDPLAEGMYRVLDGRAPQDDDEIALAEQLLVDHGLAVGDTVDPGGTGPLTVVGELVDPTNVHRRVAVTTPATLDQLLATHDALPTPTWLLGGVDDPARTAVRLYERYDRATGLSESREQHAAQAEPTERDVPPGTVAAVPVEGAAEVPASPRTTTRTGMLRSLDGMRTGVDRVMTPQVIATLVAAVLLAEVALIAGAAYATGARRRLRELGLLGANGATTGHLRSAVVGEATVTGVVGGVVGVAAGVAALGFGRPLVQRFVSPLITSLELSVTDLVGPAVVAVLAVSVAAWLPARTAARVPTTTALEGRMPLSAPRRWIVPAGLGLAGFGALLLTAGILAAGPLGGVTAAIGVLLAIGGTALLTVPMIAGIGRVADRFPATLRLVLRDSGRQRTRAAAASASAMVVLIAPVLIATISLSMEQRSLVHGLPEPDNQVLLPPAEAIGGRSAPSRTGSVAAPTADGTDRDALDRDGSVVAIAEVLPDAHRADVEYLDARATVAADPRFASDPHTAQVDRVGEVGPGVRSAPDDFWSYGGPRAHVATATTGLLDLLDHPGVTDAVAADQVVVLGLADRTTTVTLDGREVDATEVRAATLHAFPRVLVPPERVAELDLGIVGTGDLFVVDTPITSAQRMTLYDTVDVGALWVGSRGPGNGAWVRWVAIGATLVVALLILALVTMLSATESDHDLRTMVAVGAAPRMRRRFLGLQSGVHALVGALLAVPLALALAWAASRAEADYVNQGVFGAVSAQAMWLDWTAVGVVLLGVPAVIGAVIALLVRSAPTVPPRRLG